MEQMKYLSEKLLANKMRQRELAKRAGVSATNINDILKGRRPLPVEMAIKIEKVLLGFDAKLALVNQLNDQIEECRVKYPSDSKKYKIHFGFNVADATHKGTPKLAVRTGTFGISSNLTAEQLKEPTNAKDLKDWVKDQIFYVHGIDDPWNLQITKIEPLCTK